MPPDLPNGVQIPPGGPVGPEALTAKVSRLNLALRHHSAWDVLQSALREVPDLVLVSSFGTQSVVLLHLASMVSKDLPVIFIDTQMLFTETLVYQHELAERLALRNIRILQPGAIATDDPDGSLHRRDPDACCALRKSAPLDAALSGVGGWITGRKRFQSGTRAQLDYFELESPRAAPPRIKVNPLAYWSTQDLNHYMDENRLPRHPLVAQGYASVGCTPCTSPVKPGEDPRAGRWRNSDKEECGIHFANGKLIRQGALT